jgi:hypothetical protein
VRLRLGSVSLAIIFLTQRYNKCGFDQPPANPIHKLHEEAAIQI